MNDASVEMEHRNDLPQLTGDLFLTDEGRPDDLGARYAGLRERLPELNVLGGCCGADDRHVAEICRAWIATARA
jgi:methionine synthase I (cobalamin-dependent)